MSRLDLLKQGKSTKKTTPTKPSGRGGLMGEKTKKTQAREDDLSEDILDDDDFQNELEDAQAPSSTEYDLNDDDDEEVNVIELDFELDSEKGLNIDSSLMGDDEEPDNNSTEIEPSTEDKDDKSAIVEGGLGVDYSEDDIKLEIEYSFDERDSLYDSHVKVIKDGGLEVAASKILHIEDIIRISITLSELKEQVGCEARVVSVFPRNIRASENKEDQYRYIVQFIGPNATETERVLSKYLLGYKPK
jgi:Tfp pilus assembly protein PilZ